VEFENDKVVVLRVRMEVHERTALARRHPEGSGLADASAAQGHTSADGRMHRVAPSAGSRRMVSRAAARGENLGNAPIEFLAIVPK